jgi:hypothetical protein
LIEIERCGRGVSNLRKRTYDQSEKLEENFRAFFGLFEDSRFRGTREASNWRTNDP